MKGIYVSKEKIKGGSYSFIGLCCTNWNYQFLQVLVVTFDRLEATNVQILLGSWHFLTHLSLNYFLKQFFSDRVLLTLIRQIK